MYCTKPTHETLASHSFLSHYCYYIYIGIKELVEDSSLSEMFSDLIRFDNLQLS